MMPRGPPSTAQGFPVRVLPDLGARELVDPALMSGLVQVVPEYSGSALEFVSLGRQSATSDVTATGRALAGWVAGRGLVAGRPSAAQDANVIVVTAATAARYDLRSVADLAKVAPRLAFGGPPECPQRVYCLLGLKQVYGLRFKAFIPLDAGGALTLQALQAGDIGVALLFSTDPAITADHLVVLADDRGLQPAENVVPLVRRDAVARHGPRLLAVLDTVSARLSTGSLRALDAQVELRGDNPGSVAWTWLRAGADLGGGCGAVTENAGTVTPLDGTAAPSPGPAVRRPARRRRPTGAPPPLPHPVSVTTTAWLILAVAVLAGAILVSVRAPSLRLDDQVNAAVLRLFARARTPWLTGIARGISVAGSGWGATAVGLSVVALTMAFRRWRHLLIFGCSLAFLELAGYWINRELTRPRPYGVPIIAGWAGYSAPALPAGILTTLLIGIAYCLVVPGRPRSCAKAAIAVVVTVFCLACLYLAVDHVDDILLGVALGVAIPVSAFRFFTPNEVIPVAYRRGNTAHVDVTGRRGDAIRQGTRDQLGLTVTEITPVGLESSAGSTPLRLRVEGGPEEYLFAKLYTKGHVRADRWYKMWRMIRCGSLEDEHPFQTVRRLTEYEDYALRLLQDVGIRTAKPHGIVEITPEREYMIVTEFFSGAVELGDADVDDDVIDQGLLLVRKLWDAGIAHRDIKPGNLMVRQRELLLVDVMFVQVRPSPWRQAVDLGNMMLVLAVRTDPERVYRRALNYFTPAELAEAFAATRGPASPTQLRSSMKKDPRDLLGTFRALAPPREPIPVQRWSFQRVGLALAILAATAIAVAVSLEAFKPTGDIGAFAPECGTGHSIILAAQTVPSAALVPCVAALPAGWQVRHSADIASGHATFWLDSDVAGTQALAVTLSAICDVSGATQVRSDQPGTRRFDRPLSRRPQFAELRFYTFPGGCVSYQFNFDPAASPLLVGDVMSAVGFVPRAKLVDYIRSTEGLALCGRGAACPG